MGKKCSSSHFLPVIQCELLFSVSVNRSINLSRTVMVVPVKELALSLYSYPVIKLVLRVR